MADITRSCSADLRVSVQGGNNLSYHLVQRVTAQNRLYANAARERAREALISCFREHWAMRMSTDRPYWCANVEGYPFQALSQELSRDVCRANPGRDSLVISIAMHISGERGCEGVNEWAGVRMATGYRIYCRIPREEVMQGTDMPGFDYRNFPLAVSRWQECQKHCEDETRCQAWTYVHPRGGQPAHCWLKDRVPDRVSSSCCVSGTKGEVLH